MKLRDNTSLSHRAARTLQRAADSVIEDAMGAFRVASPPYRAAVSPGLWRGSKPLAEDLAWMKQQGIRTVVDLRWNTERAAGEVPASGLAYLNEGFVDGGIPKWETLDRILERLADPAAQPCYVHCREGVGRTGIVVACYRIRYEGLPVEAAIADAKAHGMRLPWQETFIRNFAQREALRSPPLPADGWEPTVELG